MGTWASRAMVYEERSVQHVLANVPIRSSSRTGSKRGLRSIVGCCLGAVNLNLGTLNPKFNGYRKP